MEAYDLIHARKPYRDEAADVRRRARRAAGRTPRTLLDVACGTGRHLQEFARWFDCVGVDVNPAMLAAARNRLHGVPLVRASMESFDLGRTFDVVTCLFSAIGYTKRPTRLRRAVRAMARHVAPGGVLIVEPWLAPEIYRVGRVDAVDASADGLKVLRMNSTGRVRNVSVMDLHYLIGSAGKVEYLLERHELGLFSRSVMEAAFRSSGLEPRYVRPSRLWGRGLYVATWGRSEPTLRAGRRGRRVVGGRRRRSA